MRISSEERAWIRFLESPVAELEFHGMEIKFIAEIERVYGIYVKDLRLANASTVTLSTSNFGRHAVRQLQTALNLLWEELQIDELRKDQGQGGPTQTRRYKG